MLFKIYTVKIRGIDFDDYTADVKTVKVMAKLVKVIALLSTSTLAHSALLNVSFTIHGILIAFDKRRANVDFPAARYPVIMMMCGFITYFPLTISRLFYRVAKACCQDR